MVLNPWSRLHCRSVAGKPGIPPPAYGLALHVCLVTPSPPTESDVGDDSAFWERVLRGDGKAAQTPDETKVTCTVVPDPNFSLPNSLL